jgi:hypothetical protein
MLLVSISGTLWLLISLAFILDSVDAPRYLVRATLALLGLAFVAVVFPFSQVQCSGGPCIGGQGLADEWYAALTYGLPGIAIAFTAALVAYGVLRHRDAKA